MKTKNIFKVGVLSIIFLSLLISPVLVLNTQHAQANGNVVAEWESFKEATSNIKEKSPTIICGTGEDKSIWEPDWLEWALCMLQKSIVEGTGAMISGTMNSLISLILWAFDPATYGGFVENDSVRTIWKDLRDFMNLALVLILVVIAIASILGVKKYRWQETLWKLIVVALLINFSLVIPGIILDASHFVTYTFLNLAKLDNNNIATSMMTAFRTEEVSGEEKYALSFIDDTSQQDEKKGWAYSWGNFFLVMAALIILGLFAIISLLAIFVTMIFRSGFIMMLLCVAPLAFAAWVLPATEKYWKMWWDQFIKWCTFPVVFALMLYMGLFILNTVNQVDISHAGDKAGPISMFIQIFLFSMFLVGGLIFSVQAGGATSQAVTKLSGKLAVGAGALLSTKLKGKIVESPTYAKAGQALTSVPLLRGVGQEMLVAGEKMKAGRVKEHEKELETVSLGTLKQLEEAKLPSKLEREAYEKRIALVNKLAEMGELGKNSVEFIKHNKDDIRFNKKAIAEAIPHYFKIDEDGKLVETGDDIKDKVLALSRIKPDKIKDKTQASDFIKDIMKSKASLAAQEGKTEEEQEAIKQETFEKIIQEITKTLSTPQLAGWWLGLSPKDMVEKGWGGPNGMIVQAIEKDPKAKRKFYEEDIPASSALRGASGISSPEKKGAKE